MAFKCKICGRQHRDKHVGIGSAHWEQMKQDFFENKPPIFIANLDSMKLTRHDIKKVVEDWVTIKDDMKAIWKKSCWQDMETGAMIPFSKEECKKYKKIVKKACGKRWYNM